MKISRTIFLDTTTYTQTLVLWNKQCQCFGSGRMLFSFERIFRFQIRLVFPGVDVYFFGLSNNAGGEILK